jgi:peroxiredoxin
MHRRGGDARPGEWHSKGMADLTSLPRGLPVPIDDGGASHLAGRQMPELDFPATTGCNVRLEQLGGGRTVLYVFPGIGRPDQRLPADWDLVPGARGCTPEACAFRDHHRDLVAAGASVFGLSGQSTDDQAEAAVRLHLPFALLSDTAFRLEQALRLPTFHLDGQRFYKRLTMVVREGIVEHVFYPVFPPDQHAQEVLTWLRDHRPTPSTA